jgi:hypothetical protein
MTPLDGTKNCGKNQPIREFAGAMRELARCLREFAGAIRSFTPKFPDDHFLLA